MTKYIPQENADLITKLINVCKSIHPEISFRVYDSEDLIYKSKTPDAELILNEMDGGDEEIGINCYLDGKNIGWFGLLPYEDEDSVIYNHSDNEFANKVYELLNKEEIVDVKADEEKETINLQNVHLTDNEIDVLKSAVCEDGSFRTGFTYEIQVYNYTKISTNASKGALSSLVKKGILKHKRVREDSFIWNFYYGTENYVNELEEKFGK